jgi:CheY-like chemotaxis protein
VKRPARSAIQSRIDPNPGPTDAKFRQAMSNNEVEILLVDDCASDAKLLLRWLEGSSMVRQVHVVHNGEEALAFLERRATEPKNPLPDLVLLDVNLPRMSGFEVLSRLKADARLARISVVVLSSSSFAEDRQRASDLQARLFLHKPSDADEFAALVQAIESLCRE